MAAAAILGAACAHAQTWATREHVLSVDGMERSYLVFAPRDLPVGTDDGATREPRPDLSRPAMLVLHGGLGNAAGVDRLYGMNTIAEREGFLAVYPNGPRIGELVLRQQRTWNAGACCGPAADKNIDDVAFIRRLIDGLVADYAVDRSRVYASGMSNGAMMTYRLVCEAPDIIAAAIPVAGALVLDACDAGAEVPILHIHGADDQNVPIAGGIGRRSLVDIDYRPLEETLRLMAGMRDCAEPVVRTDEFGAAETTYTCAMGAPIIVKILPGVGHTWPGSEPRRLQRDRYDGGFSASQAAWDFARQFSR
jgi:polyhydroxybutyrate depolymerase